MYTEANQMMQKKRKSYKLDAVCDTKGKNAL